MYIISYLSNPKQCVRINDTYSEFENIIMGVTQGSILGPLLFNLSINYLLFFILIPSVHNFADDNTLQMTTRCHDNKLSARYLLLLKMYQN